MKYSMLFIRKCEKQLNHLRLAPNKKVYRNIGLIVLITGFLAVVLWINGQRASPIVDGQIERPNYVETSDHLQLDVYLEDEDSPYYQELDINAVTYTQEEILDVFDTVYDDLLDAILGENTSLMEVKSTLSLVSQLDSYPVSIEWYSSDYTCIDSNGNVHNESLGEDETVEVVLTVLMKYESYSAEYEIDTCVCARSYTEEEEQSNEIEEAVNSAENEDRNNTIVSLPGEINGQKASYYYHNNGASPGTVLVLGVLAIGVVLLGEWQKKKKSQQLKQEQMKSDYSELITKLVLLIGAGMTIRKAWETIVKEYQERVISHTENTHYVYEEMAECINEIKSGISEELAYERFGQRCNVKEYLKLGALLQQNLRKGTKDLLHLLEQEAFEAFDTRKKHARKKGEEAGTKLLLPMIMMLVVVMVIVMVPAMISFQM